MPASAALVQPKRIWQGKRNITQRAVLHSMLRNSIGSRGLLRVRRERPRHTAAAVMHVALLHAVGRDEGDAKVAVPIGAGDRLVAAPCHRDPACGTPGREVQLHLLAQKTAHAGCLLASAISAPRQGARTALAPV